MAFIFSPGSRPPKFSIMIRTLKKDLFEKYSWYNYHKARRAFEKAVPYRNFLPDEAFQEFIDRYGKIPAAPAQDYSLGGMEKLAAERIDDIGKRINFKPASVLEIGPGAGFVLKKFKEQGVAKVSALDIVDSLHPEVKKAGVEMVLSSADDMQVIPDKSYELIISWSALEHIPNPGKVFNECLRILKPGGYLLMQFGLLYYSPWGYHHYSVIKSAYLHILFPEHLIHAYGKEKKGEGYAGYLPWTNGEPLEAYDWAKKGLPYGYLLCDYASGFDISRSSVISRYPEIFKSKGVSFESFFVDWIRIAVRRIP